MNRHSIVPAGLQAPAAQVAALFSVHFMADMLGGILPGLLPVALTHFGMDLGMGVVIITCMGIGSNLLQIPISAVGRQTRSPALLILGLAMAGLIVLLAVLPASTPFAVLCLLMLVVGAGIALVHPHGLRGIQQIRQIASSISVSAFMTGGFFGSAVGPWVSALLVGSLGLRGLYWMLLPLLLVMFALPACRIRLEPDQSASAVGGTSGGTSPRTSALSDAVCPWSFLSLCVIATLLNTGTITIQALLPSYLVALDHPLSFGGFCAMLFGAGSAAGSIAIGFLVQKYRTAPFVLGGLLLGIPVLFLYFLLAGQTAACLLIFLGGLLASSCFPILVPLARGASGSLPMSTRMGLIVGGSWGIAGIVLLGIGQLAARFGLAPVMHLSWVFYLLALLTTWATMRRPRVQSA